VLALAQVAQAAPQLQFLRLLLALLNTSKQAVMARMEEHQVLVRISQWLQAKVGREM
jgi:hypothetical protein